MAYDENKYKNTDDIDFGMRDDIDENFIIRPTASVGANNISGNEVQEYKGEKNENGKENNNIVGDFDETDEDESGENKPDSTGEKSTGKDDFITLPKSKIILVKKLINNIKENNERLRQLFVEFALDEKEISIGIEQIGEEHKREYCDESEGKVIEGVFDGEQMIGPDGKQYSVPANYASKSKLVEGDIMKLTITSTGIFIFKQIGPIERNRIVARLERSSDGIFYASLDGKKWRLLTASITYYKGETGDEVVILTPKHGESKWAAVDNVVKEPIR